MKSAHEILRGHNPFSTEIRENESEYVVSFEDAIEAMKEYAKQVAAQALKDAAENAKITYLTIQNNEGKPDVIQPIVNKESITKTKIETP